MSRDTLTCTHAHGRTVTSPMPHKHLSVWCPLDAYPESDGIGVCLLYSLIWEGLSLSDYLSKFCLVSAMMVGVNIYSHSVV